MVVLFSWCGVGVFCVVRLDMLCAGVGRGARFWAFWLGECLGRGFVLLVFPGWCSLCAVGGVGAVELWCVFVRCCFISSDVWCAW